MDTILLVEDEPTDRGILSAYLRRTGYAIDEAEDGSAAWEMLKLNPAYAAVVTDRSMPLMSGLELVKAMRGHDQLKHIPVIMQTAASRQEELAEGIKAGVYYYLTKPYKEEALVALVKSAIGSRRKYEIAEARFNRQRHALGTCAKAEFHVRTFEEAENIALMLGGLFPRPELAVCGIYELLVNAIEHGNLGIGYHEKARLLANSAWEEAVRQRLQAPSYCEKKVTVHFTQTPQKLEMLIADEGSGFDWQPFMEIEPSRALEPNGRGIAKANLLAFDRLVYLGSGNQVQIMSRRDNSKGDAAV